MKECIRCGSNENDINECYVGWGTYEEHDFSKPIKLDKKEIEKIIRAKQG